MDPRPDPDEISLYWKRDWITTPAAEEALKFAMQGLIRDEPDSLKRMLIDAENQAMVKQNSFAMSNALEALRTKIQTDEWGFRYVSWLDIVDTLREVTDSVDKQHKPWYDRG